MQPPALPPVLVEASHEFVRNQAGSWLLVVAPTDAPVAPRATLVIHGRDGLLDLGDACVALPGVNRTIVKRLSAEKAPVLTMLVAEIGAAPPRWRRVHVCIPGKEGAPDEAVDLEQPSTEDLAAFFRAGPVEVFEGGAEQDSRERRWTMAARLVLKDEIPAA